MAEAAARRWRLGLRCHICRPAAPAAPAIGLGRPQELLLAFIACALERDDRTGTKELAAVIDSFQFNFSAGDAPGSTAAGTPRTDSLAGGARRPTVVEPRLPRAGGGGPPAAPVVVGHACVPGAGVITDRS